MDRRSFLKGLAAAGAATAASSALPAQASEKPQAPADAVGLLYDATRCIGCKACVVKCREANGLPPERSADGLHDQQLELNGNTKNVIQLVKDGDKHSYVKRQCMHCIDPACVTACMIGALQKREHGVVSYEADKCIGCRYCQVACPFNVPKFEWQSATPKIVKCEMCIHLQKQGKQPACTEVCPRQAVIFGNYKDLLADAHARLKAEPGKYVQKVYGEEEGGGTQVLYLAAMDFEKLGLPDLGPDSMPGMAKTIQHGIYQGFIAPAVLYAALGVAIWRNRHSSAEGGEGKKE